MAWQARGNKGLRIADCGLSGINGSDSRHEPIFQSLVPRLQRDRPHHEPMNPNPLPSHQNGSGEGTAVERRWWFDDEVLSLGFGVEG